MWIWGSSPLTRGKQFKLSGSDVGHGLIPAHAGKTDLDGGDHALPGAHPRSRGENSQSSSEIRRRVGSSPLTRGKPGARSGRPARGGLIPAHAGKTACGIYHIGGVGAHPRSRGENRRCGPGSAWAGGSSPLTRGKHAAGAARGGRGGLIPAHAGKTLRSHI